jgi:hypothetical protein
MAGLNSEALHNSQSIPMPTARWRGSSGSTRHHRTSCFGDSKNSNHRLQSNIVCHPRKA